MSSIVKKTNNNTIEMVQDVILKLDNFDELFEKLEKRISPLKLSPATLVSIIQSCIELVELSNKKGPEKKVLVIVMVETLIDDSDLPNEDYNFMKELVKNGTLSDTIDLVISASRGKLGLNDIDEVVETACSCCYSFYKFKILPKKNKKNKTNKNIK
jgi:hypothetical protein